jgi:tryptophan halogenase
MRVGRRQNFWVGNCLSAGLSAGFLEPLESTGIFLAQKGVELLLDHFPDADFDEALIRRYNAHMAAEFEHVRDFIILHYLLNSRVEQDERGFWRANRHASPPPSLAGMLEFYDHTGIVEWQRHSLFQDASFYALTSGFGRLPRTHHPLAGHTDTGKAWQAMQRIKAQNRALAAALPDHGAFVRDLHAARAPEAAEPQSDRHRPFRDSRP